MESLQELFGGQELLDLATEEANLHERRCVALHGIAWHCLALAPRL